MRPWLALLRFGALIAVLGAAGSGIALADELRRARAAELPTIWLSNALAAAIIMLFVGVVGAIATERA